MSDRLPSLLELMRLIDRFQQVERALPRRGEDRLENDVEHSYQLAMAAWYLNATEELGMDSGLLLAFALVHDLAEVYAGDTYAYTADADERATKEAREAAAVARIADEFPEFPDLVETIHTYERRDTREARFVYALDKLLPILGNYLDNGRMWRAKGVTLAMLKDYKQEKIAESPEAYRHYEAIIAILEERPDLFPSA